MILLWQQIQKIINKQKQLQVLRLRSQFLAKRNVQKKAKNNKTILPHNNRADLIPVLLLRLFNYLILILL